MCSKFRITNVTGCPLKLASRTAAQSAKKVLGQELEGIKEAGTWKTERIITSKMGPAINVTGKEQQILNFCANNYLGLSVSVLTLEQISVFSS